MQLVLNLVEWFYKRSILNRFAIHNTCIHIYDIISVSMRQERLYFASNTCSICLIIFFRVHARTYNFFLHILYNFYLSSYLSFSILGTFLDGYRMSFFLNCRISFFGISGSTIKNLGQL